LLVKIFVALAFVWGCSVNVPNTSSNAPDTSSDISDINSEVAGTLTVELDVGQNNTKSVIEVEELDILGATIALTNSLGEGEVKTWKPGDPFVYTFQAKKTGLHTLTVVDWDKAGHTNVATKQIDIRNGKNYRVRVQLGGKIYIDSLFGEIFTFDDGNTNGWVEMKRYWHLTNGTYCLDGDYMPGRSNPFDRDGYSFYRMGDSSLKNYTFTVDVKGLDGFMNGFKQPLLLFHVIHWQTSFSIIPFTAYRFSFIPADSSQRAGEWVLEKFTTVNTNTQIERLKSGISSAFVSNWNTIKIITKDNGYIAIYANNILITELTDSNPIPYGGIGLGSIWETGSQFDNVEISYE